MGVFHGPGEVDDRQEKENESLHKGNEDTQGHDRQRGEEGTGQSEKNAQNNLVAHHVSEQTERERQDPRQMPDDLDDKDQRRHPPDRPHKVFDVAGAMVFDADDVGEHHDYQGTGPRGVEVGGGRKEPGDNPDQVADEDVEKKGGRQGKEPSRLFTGRFHHELFDARDDHFKQVLGFSRYHGDGFGGQGTGNNQDRHEDPGVDHMRVCVGEMPQPDRFKNLHEK